MSIPKIIHYCWFGGNTKSKKIEKCIESWKEKLPDYEIIEWNEERININNYKFAKRAMKYKQYAFVADYIRTYVLYTYGGIYLDTDQEILKNIDHILENNAFIGMEDDDHLSCEIIGVNKNAQWLKNILDRYDKIKFNPYDLDSMLIPKIYTDEIINQGLKFSNDKVYYNDTITIYPSEYFYPIDFKSGEKNITENTIAIHHWDGSWKKNKKISYWFKVKAKIYYSLGINI